MRIPYKINKTTHTTYEASAESLALLGELGRLLTAENFQWDKDHCPTLADLCVQTIQANFEKDPILDQLQCPDRDYLVENLDNKLSLELVIPLIEVPTNKCFKN